MYVSIIKGLLISRHITSAQLILITCHQATKFEFLPELELRANDLVPFKFYPIHVSGGGFYSIHWKGDVLHTIGLFTFIAFNVIGGVLLNTLYWASNDEVISSSGGVNCGSGTL